ncbi:branched-chain amino acid ABC transporter permease [Amycolatopsis sp. NPDC047767]|uniref:branched-chain amino acid ABC transporter permease n=1 Tax=Amycolatopsis sp. NPDC047767 TaxID=3156765 RepID=UPI003452233A
MVTTATFGTGIVNGFALALVSLGFTLVYRATGVVNFANGSQMVLGGYVAWELGSHGFPAWVVMLGAVAAGVASGVVVDQIALRPLRGASLLAQIIVLIAVTEVAGGLFLSSFGAEAKTMTPYAGRSPIVPGLGWSASDLVLMAVSFVLVAGLTLVLRGTSAGLRMRLVASNRLGATVVGVNPARVSTLAWCVGGGLAALSGALIFPTYLLSPDLGQQYTFDSFAAVVLGGFGSLPGAAVGGVLIGVVQSVVSGAIGASYSAFVSLGVMLVILLTRPTGLFGARA